MLGLAAAVTPGMDRYKTFDFRSVEENPRRKGSGRALPYALAS